MTDLPSLKERIETAGGKACSEAHVRSIIFDFCDVFDIEPATEGRISVLMGAGAYTDAALTLVDRMLPGCGVELNRFSAGVIEGPQWECEISAPGRLYKIGECPSGESDSPALAILTALLTALTQDHGDENV